MAVLPLVRVPFFRDKNRAFWRLQFIGWGGALTLRGMTTLAAGAEPSFLIIQLILTITGFSLSLILSVIYRFIITQKPLVTWGVSVSSLLAAVALNAFLDSWLYGLYEPESLTDLTSLLLRFFLFDLILLGAYSALYYAINFYLQVEQQGDRIAALELQATSAQLAMLRYQLNPHFLFNTLNSISTLVLLGQRDPANAMLNRLSSFLRHTLVSEPGGKVTVAQEIDTLQLYLGIEQMRFEERLRTDFRIAPGAAFACLPSMLLQPLVENAIKYAVSPQEEGAEIRVSAIRAGSRLQITVADTGPGVPGGATTEQIMASQPAPGDPNSTGVGLANIHNRLFQAYGDDHRFEIRAPADGGFTVLIELPFEREEPTEHEGDDDAPATQAVTDGNRTEKPLAPPHVQSAENQTSLRGTS